MSQLMKNKIGQQVKPYKDGGKVISKKAVGKKDIPDTDKTSPGKSNTPDKFKKGGKC